MKLHFAFVGDPEHYATADLPVVPAVGDCISLTTASKQVVQGQVAGTLHMLNDLGYRSLIYLKPISSTGYFGD